MGDAVRALLAGATRDVSNVVVLTPALSDSENEAWTDLLTISDVAHENVLSVTLTQSAEDRLTLWHTHVGEETPGTGDGHLDRTTAAVGGCDTVDTGAVAINTVPDPAAPTDLDVSPTDYLSDWRANDSQTVGCVQSVDEA